MICDVDNDAIQKNEILVKKTEKLGVDSVKKKNFF